MTQRVTEESAGIPAEVLITIVILLILFWLLAGQGSIEGLFSLFKSFFTFIFIYILGGLKLVLQG